MNIDEYLTKVKRGMPVTFQETVKAIEKNFIYRPVQFSNGLGGGRIRFED